MLRPDRYIVGLAGCAGDLERLSELLPGAGPQKPGIARSRHCEACSNEAN
jgi:hypothetical protein